jgi:LmbE family N-acetylglucosaminyl deacetylase
LLHHHVNSDEPQHLHVAWGWTQGLLPYRDVFDNHAPLFSLVMSLPMRLLGERPDIVLYMRLWMLPFALGSTVLVAVIARRLFTARVALWSVVLLGAMPDFLLGSVEYRTDVPWAFVWLAALAVLVGGRLTRRRAFATGLLLGTALAISMKTSLLLTTAFGAAAVTWFATHPRPPLARVAALTAAATAGLLVVPLMVVTAFAWLGDLSAMARCTLGYNVVPGMGLWGTAPLRPLGLLVGLPLLFALGTWVARRSPTPELARRRTLLLASVGLAHLAIETVWPLVVRGDLLPLQPIEAIFFAALLTSLLWPDRGPARSSVRRTTLAIAAMALVALGGLASTFRIEDLARDGVRPERRLLAEVLRLTSPKDRVMDVKGESIFRRRSIYTAIESIAEERYRRGELVDDIPEQLIATRTPVVVQYYVPPFPRRAWAFMQANYLPVDGVRVLGQYLDPPAAGPDDRAFLISIPQRYAMFGLQGVARGTLDGEPWRGARWLARGPHRYVAAPGEQRIAAVWAPAAERGFAPALLADSPLVLKSSDRLLVLAPHPDDETVANGGLILAARAANAAVEIVWATDGERNPWAQLVHEGHWPWRAADRARWGTLRRAESRSALRVLGATSARQTWLGLPDGGLTRQWMLGNDQLADSLVRVMREFRPTVVSAPSLFDGHPDHSAMGLAANVAIARLEPSSRPRLLQYVAHRLDLAPAPTVCLRVSRDQVARQRLAIECLPSQLHWRRSQLTGFADTTEWFDSPDTEAVLRQMQRVRNAWIEGHSVMIDFVRGRSPSFGPLTLHVSCDDAQGPLERLTVPLPSHPGDLQVFDSLGHAGTSTARLSRVRDGWRVEVPLVAGGPSQLTFVKIDRPKELAWGFFDKSGWWPVRNSR